MTEPLGITAERALEDSERHLRAIVDSAPMGIAVSGMDGVFVRANQAFCRALGYTESELTRLSFRDITHPDDLVSSAAMVQDLDAGKILNFVQEKRYLKKGGGVIVGRVLVGVVRDDLGKPLHHIAQLEDITDHKQAEETLRAERESFRNSLEMSPLGIQIINFQGELLYVNRTMLAMWGYGNLAELKSVPMERRFASESVALIGEINRKREKGETPETHEVTILCRNGRSKVLRTYNNEVVWNGDRCAEVLCEDITERQRIECELARVSSHRQSLLAAVPDILMEVDIRKVYTWSNQAGLEFFGDDVIGQEATDYFVDAQNVYETVEPVFEGQDCTIYVESWQRRKDGEPRLLAWYCRRLMDDQGRVIGALSAAKDITDTRKSEEALAAEKQNFRNSVEASPFGIQIVTFHGTLIYSNRTMLDMWGFATFEEAKATPRGARFTPCSVETIDRNNELLRHGRIPPPYEVTIVRREGAGTRDLEAFSKDIIWNGERCVQILYQDVTERKRAEEALRESERKYRDLVDNSPVGIVVTTPEGRVVEVNKRLPQMHGYGSKEEFIASAVADRFRDLRDRDLWLALLRETGRVDGYEIETRRKDGSLFWTSLTSIPRSTETGEPQQITISQDVTEKKLAQEVLRQSEEKLRLMFQSVAEGIAVVSLNGRVTQANLQLAQMFGSTPDDMVGRSAFGLVASGDRKPLREFTKKLVEDGKLDQVGFRARRLDGKTFPAEASAGLLRDHAGEPVGSVVTVRDITETQRMQQQLVAQDRLVSIGEMVSGVAHEINNPLTGVLGFSQLLMQRDLPGDAKEELGIVVDEAQRAARIVKNLLTFARKHAPVKQSCRVNDIVEDVLRLRAYEEQVSNIAVVRRLAVDLPEIMADYFQIQQVFLNIIVNAEFFMIEVHRAGTLTITTERVGSQVSVTFADDGPGISPDNLGKIFDPFFTTKEVGRGTGLGLSICHGIVSEHGGTIRAESELGHGATLIVELPVANPSVDLQS